MKRHVSYSLNFIFFRQLLLFLFFFPENKPNSEHDMRLKLAKACLRCIPSIDSKVSRPRQDLSSLRPRLNEKGLETPSLAHTAPFLKDSHDQVCDLTNIAMRAWWLQYGCRLSYTWSNNM